MAHSLVETLIQTSTYPLSSSEPEEKPQKAKKSSLSRQELIEATAWLLEEMIDQASTNYTDPAEIPDRSIFHAQKRSSITIKDYMVRFATYSQCHDDVFIYAMIYLDKIGENLCDFELDSFNVHR